MSHPKLRASLSPRLRGRMQGKTCFNFTTSDADLFRELEEVTMRALTAFRGAGFIAADSST
jgi:hypothetical protein